MHIRAELPADAKAIEQVTIQAFKDAPHTDHTEQFIVRELRAAGALALSLVAEIDGQIVGHVAISPVHISDGSQHWFGLGPSPSFPKGSDRVLAVHSSGQPSALCKRSLRKDACCLANLTTTGALVSGRCRAWSCLECLPSTFKPCLSKARRHKAR